MAEQIVELAPGESKVISFEVTPHEAKTYQVQVDGLSGSFEAINPDLEFIEFNWDTAPPFQAPSQHQFNAIFRNLRPFDFRFRAEIYANGVLWKTWPSYQAPGGETFSIVDRYIFNTAGVYTITVKAFYDTLLLDQISSTVTVKAPPPTEIIDGQFRQAFVRWEGETYWHGMSSTNTWPADKLMEIRVSVLNTGNVRATFRIGGMPGTVSLIPGEYDLIDVPPFYAVDGTYTWELYGNGKKVDTFTFNVTTY